MLTETKSRSKSGNTTTLVRFLSSGVDMEEQFSSSVYHDYLDPACWPAGFRQELLEQIQERLMTLIEDSKKHEETLRELAREYSSVRRDRRTVIRELELMEGFEQSARDFYTKLCMHPQIKEEHVKETFKNLADAEQRHARVVREIIDLVNSG